MTLGERISNCRKQQGLSQEALGERVGVSRQAIYKWESDQAIPELDKLITLTQVFGVTIGWLVCEEETAEAPSSDRGTEPPPEYSGVTREELEIYLDRLRELPSVSPKSKKWPVVLIAVLCAALLVGLAEIRKMQKSYERLENTVQSMQIQNRQAIDNVTWQVQSALEHYNDLTISAETKIDAIDFANNTVTFRLSAQPKTFTEGMHVCYRADFGEGIAEAEGVLQEDRCFTALLTCPLLNDITLSVDFAAGDTIETKVLREYSDLYQRSFGFWYFIWPMSFHVRDGRFLDRYCEVIYDPGYEDPADPDALPLADIASMDVALYEDGEKIAVYEPIGGIPQDVIFLDGNTSEALPAFPVELHGVLGGDSGRTVTVYFRYPKDVQLDLDAHEYQEVLTVTDVYGRTIEIRDDYR